MTKIADMSEPEQVESIRNNPSNIRYIKTPSEILQCVALSRRSDAIKHIPVSLLTDRSRRLAVIQCEDIHKHISDLTNEEIIINLRHFPKNILHYTNPCEEFQLAAVETDGEVVKYIKDASEKVFLAAIKSNVNSILFSDNPTEEMMRLAISISPAVVGNIKCVIPDSLQEYAVMLNSRAMRHLKKPCEAAQLAAVMNNPIEIGNISDPTPNVQIAAILQDQYCINRIAKKAPELERYIVDNIPYCFVHFHNPSIENQIRIIEKNVANAEYIKIISPVAFEFFMQKCSDPAIASKVLSSMGLARIKTLAASAKDSFVSKLTGKDLVLYLRQCGEAAVFFDKAKLTNDQRTAAIIGCKNNLSHASDMFVSYRRTLSEKNRIEIVKALPSLISLVKNPSEQVKVASVYNNPRNILSISGRTSPELQLSVAKALFRRKAWQSYYDSPGSILSSYNNSRTQSVGTKLCSVEAQLYCVKRDHGLINKFPNPTGEALVLALEKEPNMEYQIARDDKFSEDFIELYFDKVKDKSLAKRFWSKTQSTEIKVFLALAFGFSN